MHYLLTIKQKCLKMAHDVKETGKTNPDQYQKFMVSILDPCFVEICLVLVLFSPVDKTTNQPTDKDETLEGVIKHLTVNHIHCCCCACLRL